MAISIKDICRICLKGNKLMSSIFNSDGFIDYCDKIKSCTGISVSENDGFPCMICQGCESDLSITYDFISRCRESDRALRELKIDIAVKEELDDFDNADDGFSADLIKTEDTVMKFEEINSTDDPEERLCYKRKYQVKKRRLTKLSDKKCSVCNMVTASSAALIIHMRKHTGEKPCKCPHCNMAFTQMGTLKLHIARRHSNEPRHLRERRFSCETCGNRFFSKRDLVVHIRRHTGDNPYTCEHCSKNFSQIGSLIRHRRTHTGERPFSCKICGKCFADGSVLRIHQSVHSDERKFTCNICSKSFKTKIGKNKHLELHTNSKQLFICDKCGVAFSNRGNLKIHMRKRHSENSGTCTVCGKHFGDIKEHMKKHTGELSYSCSLCGKGYPSKRGLTNHTNRHQNPNTHKCDKENCSQTFPRKFQLDFHILKYHSNETPYSCKVCSKGYLRPSDLTKHLRVYHPNYNPIQ